MADWSDPRTTATPWTTTTGARNAAYDAGLRSYMLSVYNYMASAVLLTGIVALVVGHTSLAYAIAMTPLRWVVVLAPLAIVFAMSFGQNRFSVATLQALYWGYALLIGASLSTLFLVYSQTAIAQAFFATAAGFAGLSLWGYTTERNLSAFGSFLIVGLVGLIVAMLLNLWLQSGALDLVISIAGVLIFAGLTAYDTQKIKSMYSWVGNDQTALAKTAIMGALNLYLDFINMFLFILRLFGSSRN